MWVLSPQLIKSQGDYSLPLLPNLIYIYICLNSYPLIVRVDSNTVFRLADVSSVCQRRSAHGHHTTPKFIYIAVRQIDQIRLMYKIISLIGINFINRIVTKIRSLIRGYLLYYTSIFVCSFYYEQTTL